MSENVCPECLSENIDKNFGDRQSDDCEVWYCYCNKCGCDYSVIYEKIVEVYEHGLEYETKEWEEEDD